MAATLGINIYAPHEASRNLGWANVVRCSRFPYADNYSAVPLDEARNPKADFNILFASGAAVAISTGQYAVTLIGKVTGINFKDSSGSIGPLIYDAATNTTTCSLTPTVTASDKIALGFHGTQRDENAAVGSGLDLSKLFVMRPITPGSLTSHDPSELFHRQLIARASKYRRIRALDLTDANQAGRDLGSVSTWENRTQPFWGIQSSFTATTPGMAWEHVIAMANAARRGLHLNVPHNADDAYIVNLFNLIEYGGAADGTPYTSRRVNPFYKPLDPDLDVVLEWGNETWNSAGPFTGYPYFQATAWDEVAKGVTSGIPSDLVWDGETDRYAPVFRLPARGVYRLAQFAARVFGLAARGKRYRVILQSQADNLNALQVVCGYYRHLCARDGVAISDVLDGIGTGWYCQPPTVDVLSTEADWDKNGPVDTLEDVFAAGFVPPPYLAAETAWLADPANGFSTIPKYRYEGGFYYAPHDKNSALTATVMADPRFRALALAAVKYYSNDGAKDLDLYNDAQDPWGAFSGPGQPATPRDLAYDDYLATNGSIAAASGIVSGRRLRQLRRKAN